MNIEPHVRQGMRSRRLRGAQQAVARDVVPHEDGGWWVVYTAPEERLRCYVEREMDAETLARTDAIAREYFGVEVVIEVLLV